MRKWFLVLIAVNIVVFGAVIWHRRAVRPANNPNVAMARKLLQEGTIIIRTHHLKYQKFTANTWKECEPFFDDAKAEAKHPQWFGVQYTSSSSKVNCLASPEDMPLLEKALEEFDATGIKGANAVEATKGTK